MFYRLVVLLLYTLVTVQTESTDQLCREETCKNCSQAICYNEPDMMEKYACSEDTNQTIDTFTSPHGLINVDSTCSFNLNTLNTSWIQIGVFNRTLYNLAEINDGKEKSNGSCSYNFLNKETLENIGTLSVTRSLSAGDCDFYQLGNLVIEQPSDLLSISYEAEQNMSSAPFQLIYRACEYLVGDSGLVFTRKQRGCFVVGREPDVQESSTPAPIDQLTLKIAKLLNNSVIVLQHFKTMAKPEVSPTKYTDNSTRDYIVYNSIQLRQSMPLYIANSNASSANFTFQYKREMDSFKKRPVDFEVLQVPCPFSHLGEEAHIEALSEVQFNSTCPDGLYLAEIDNTSMEPPDCQPVCDYQTGEWNTTPYHCIDAYAIHSDHDKIHSIPAAKTGYIVSHTEYSRSPPDKRQPIRSSDNINSTLVLTGLQVGWWITFTVITMNLAKSHSTDCPEYLRIEGVKGGHPRTYCSILAFDSRFNRSFEILGENVSVTFFSKKQHTKGFLIEYEICDQPVHVIANGADVDDGKRNKVPEIVVTCIVAALVAAVVVLAVVVCKLKRRKASRTLSTLRRSSQSASPAGAGYRRSHSRYASHDVYCEIGDVGPFPVPDEMDGHYYSDIDKVVQSNKEDSPQYQHDDQESKGDNLDSRLTGRGDNYVLNVVSEDEPELSHRADTTSLITAAEITEDDSRELCSADKSPDSTPGDVGIYGVAVEYVETDDNYHVDDGQDNANESGLCEARPHSDKDELSSVDTVSEHNSCVSEMKQETGEHVEMESTSKTDDILPSHNSNFSDVGVYWSCTEELGTTNTNCTAPDNDNPAKENSKDFDNNQILIDNDLYVVT